MRAINMQSERKEQVLSESVSALGGESGREQGEDGRGYL